MEKFEQEALQKEFHRLNEDVLFSEKGHLIASNHCRYVHWGLGAIAIIAGVLAASNYLEESFKTVVLIAAPILSAILTFLEPSKRASVHHRIGIGYCIIRRKIRQFQELDFRLNKVDFDQSKALLAELSNEKENLMKEIPIPYLAYLCAKRSIKNKEHAYSAYK